MWLLAPRRGTLPQSNKARLGRSSSQRNLSFLIRHSVNSKFGTQQDRSGTCSNLFWVRLHTRSDWASYRIFFRPGSGLWRPCTTGMRQQQWCALMLQVRACTGPAFCSFSSKFLLMCVCGFGFPVSSLAGEDSFAMMQDWVEELKQNVSEDKLGEC